MRERKNAIILLVIPILLAIIVSIVVQGTLLRNQDQYTQWLASFGPLFIVVYILVQTLAIIIAPLGGFFIQIGLFALLPPVQALLLLYVVSTPAFFINFFLARRFGRPLVTRLIGTHAMEQVDYYIKESGVFLLIITKIFQAGVFDYVSYAAGLTNIPFQTFFLVNIFGGLPGIVFSYIILTRFTNFTISIMILLFTAYIMFGFAILLLHLKRRKEHTLKNTLEQNHTEKLD